ncbi:hypothetical protein BDV96DRAFT_644753 [Lophiotrema nucula]|uniref:Uncharacterized protein n=1 Tax=Lophiotrema nucula TaxID=690887 RepID=A0A6A5ZG41_9PLEO|nr:hypothetical protein BDV96DRAFT_644753 [Lophiotrema nucula]
MSRAVNKERNRYLVIASVLKETNKNLKTWQQAKAELKNARIDIEAGMVHQVSLAEGIHTDGHAIHCYLDKNEDAQKTYDYYKGKGGHLLHFFNITEDHLAREFVKCNCKDLLPQSCDDRNHDERGSGVSSRNVTVPGTLPGPRTGQTGIQASPASPTGYPAYGQPSRRGSQTSQHSSSSNVQARRGSSSSFRQPSRRGSHSDYPFNAQPGQGGQSSFGPTSRQNSQGTSTVSAANGFISQHVYQSQPGHQTQPVYYDDFGRPLQAGGSWQLIPAGLTEAPQDFGPNYNPGNYYPNPYQGYDSPAPSPYANQRGLPVNSRDGVIFTETRKIHISNLPSSIDPEKLDRFLALSDTVSRRAEGNLKREMSGPRRGPNTDHRVGWAKLRTVEDGRTVYEHYAKKSALVHLYSYGTMYQLLTCNCSDLFGLTDTTHHDDSGVTTNGGYKYPIRNFEAYPGKNSAQPHIIEYGNAWSSETAEDNLKERVPYSIQVITPVTNPYRVYIYYLPKDITPEKLLTHLQKHWEKFKSTDILMEKSEGTNDWKPFASVLCPNYNMAKDLANQTDLEQGGGLLWLDQNQIDITMSRDEDKEAMSLEARKSSYGMSSELIGL